MVWEKGYSFGGKVKHLIFLVPLLFIVGCGSQTKITSGTIEDKWIIPAHIETSTTYINVGNGVNIPITSKKEIPPKYVIVFCAKQLDSEKKRCRKIKVDRVKYESVEIGEYFEYER